jgi:alcohol dehydrogenase class IV
MKFVLSRNNVPVNPTIQFAREILELAKDCTEVVSIGGGGTIDVGKFVSYYLKVPHTAIPTTAGTGSEVTRYCVLMVDDQRKSLNLKVPDKYELKPELVISLPKEQTISTGLDALCQSIESWWSKDATNESKRYAEMAMELIMWAFEKSINDPHNKNLRLDMMVAANYSGRAIEITKTSTCHAISYPLTALYKVPHGLACAYTLPEMIELNQFPLISGDKIRRLLDMIGFKKIEFDKKLVFAEAQKYDRFFNSPKVPNFENLF